MHSYQMGFPSAPDARGSGRGGFRMQDVAKSPVSIALGAGLVAAGLTFVVGGTMMVGLAAALCVLAGVILASVLI